GITLAALAVFSIAICLFCRWYTSPPPVASEQVVVGVPVPLATINQWASSVNNNNNNNNNSSNIGG
ncbi:hypothetical protein A2U01_0117094, partial [Trifolium medium]|nr:hypothetical protein [Trifolium medium]